MRRVRVIPILLLKGEGLVKTARFRRPIYVGDPVNTIKIFNEKEVDEIIVLDIAATLENRPPDLSRIIDLASECFMPLCYGGGISTFEQARAILKTGVEKVAVQKALLSNPEAVSKIAAQFGNQSVVAVIDVKKDWLGRSRVVIEGGRINTGKDPVEFAKGAERLGVGEIVVNSIDREGTYSGYDLELIALVSHAVNVPVVASGGAAGIADFSKAVQAGASAVAAGSLFVFQGPLRAVLINFPNQETLKRELYNLA